jgi:hypothetical protein
MKIRRDVLLVVAIPIIFVLSIQLVLALSMPSTEFIEERPTQIKVRYAKNKVTITDVDYRIPGRDYCEITLVTDGGDGETYEVEVTLYDIDDTYIVATSETEISISIQGTGSGSNNTAVVEGHIMSPVLSEAELEDGDVIKVIIRHNNIAEVLESLFIQIDTV